MSYWKNPEDETKPCRCGCGREVSLYNKGIGKDFATDDCYEEAYRKTLKDDGEKAKWKNNDVYGGKDLNETDLTQSEYRLDSLRRAMGKARMIGDAHQEEQARQAIKGIVKDNKKLQHYLT